jgi:hypothetical protein
MDREPLKVNFQEFQEKEEQPIHIYLLIGIVVMFLMSKIKLGSSSNMKDSIDHGGKKSKLSRFFAGIEQKIRRSKTSNESVDSFFQKGKDTSKEWDGLLAAEASEADKLLLDNLSELISLGPTTSEEACKRLKVSMIKLVKHAQMLENMGLIEIDGTDKSNPILKPSSPKN